MQENAILKRTLALAHTHTHTLWAIHKSENQKN